MTFLAALIALIVERFLHWSQLRNWKWYSRYQEFLNVRLDSVSPALIFFACILPPLIIAALITRLTANWGYHIPKLIWDILILLYCLGPANLWVQIYTCIRVLNKEDTRAAIEEVKNTFQINSIGQPQAFHQAFTRAIFNAANQRIFAVLFWFSILGPIGAVLYRVTSLSKANANVHVSEFAKQGQNILDWLPARLFTFVFALGGNFNKVFYCWKKHAKQGLNSNEAILGDCGIAALDVTKGDTIPEDGSAENEALTLLDRVLVIGLIVLGLIELII